MTPTQLTELRAAETASTSAQARLEAMDDYLDLCVELDIPPSNLRAMLQGVDRSDEIAVSSVIYAGIHRFNPALDPVAHLFVKCFHKPVSHPVERGRDGMMYGDLPMAAE